MSLFDINIGKGNDSFSTSTYKKPTITGLGTKYFSAVNSLVHGPFSLIFIFGFEYSFYSSGQGKSLAVLCGPPISLEMETNYPYLHGWPQKYRSARMWADRILGARTLLYLRFKKIESIKKQLHWSRPEKSRLIHYNLGIQLTYRAAKDIVG